MTDVSAIPSTAQRLRNALQQQRQYWRMYLARQARKMGLSAKRQRALMLGSSVLMLVMLMAGFLLFNLLALSAALIGWWRTRGAYAAR